MREEKELTARAKELVDGFRRIAEDLREIRRMICPETEDPLIKLCDKRWQEYRQKAT